MPHQIDAAGGVGVEPASLASIRALPERSHPGAILSWVVPDAERERIACTNSPDREWCGRWGLPPGKTREPHMALRSRGSCYGRELFTVSQPHRVNYSGRDTPSRRPAMGYRAVPLDASGRKPLCDRNRLKAVYHDLPCRPIT